METYQTSDLYLTAFLKCKGLQLIKTNKTKGRVVFVFKDTEKRLGYLDEFFNDGVVSILSFKNTIQDLKTLIYNT